MPFPGLMVLTSLHLVNIQPNLKPHPSPKFSGFAPEDKGQNFWWSIGCFNKKQRKTIGSPIFRIFRILRILRTQPQNPQRPKTRPPVGVVLFLGSSKWFALSNVACDKLMFRL